jgi:hypothetical protein
MAYQACKLQYPTDMPTLGNYGYSTGLLIDATGEKIAMIGRFWNASRSAKSIRKVGFRFGAVTKAGGSALTVSLQNVSTSANPPQPDGTQDETVAIANANAAFASKTWIMTGNLSADRSVSFGEELAVVVEYDGSGRIGSDSVVVSSILTATNSCNPVTSLYTSSWATSTRTPNFIFECSDGTFATFDGCSISKDSSSATYNSGSTPDEYGNEFQIPFACKTDGAWLLITPQTTSSDFEVVLYSGTTALATATVDASTAGPVTGRIHILWGSEIELAANTNYILALKPTTANNVSLGYFDVDASTHWDATGIPTCAMVTRTNAGSWSGTTTTRRMTCGLNVSAIDTGGGSGGVPLIGTGGLVY